MEPIVVAAIGAIGGLASGLVVALVKPVGEDWQERRRETRKRKRDDLDRMADLVRMSGVDAHLLRLGAASIADDQLIAFVARIIAATDTDARTEARGDASNRVGELRAKL